MGKAAPLEKIGRYEVGAELGKGAMGLVYKATDPNIGRVVALKTMRLDVHGLDADEMLQRFRNEARAAGLLNHPNIVTIYDAGESDGMFYIAMEYIEGRTLHHLMNERKQLETADVVEMGKQICAGLDAAHAQGVIHRDVKPANIMIEPDGRVKIMDFGIAKAGGGMTSAGQVLGTPNYMSPEQVKGKKLDGRADLFSLGVIFYEMVTGKRPFTGENVTTIIYKIINEHPTPPRELDASIPPGIQAIITRCLAKSPEDRYQTGADIARDLQNYKSLSAAERRPRTPHPIPPAHPPATPGPETQAPAHPPAHPAPLSTPHPTAPTASHPAHATSHGSTSRVSTGYSETVFDPRKAKTSKFPIRPSHLGTIALVLLLVIGGVELYRYQQGREAAEQQRLEEEKKKEADQVLQVLGNAGKNPETRTEGSPGVGADTAPASNAGGGLDAVRSAPAGELMVSSTPPGARVDIDGKHEVSWVTPRTIRKLAPGPHTLVFSKSGFKSEMRVVEVQNRKTVYVNANLTPGP